MSNNLICFDRPTFQMYMVILIAVIGFLTYYFSSSKEKLADVDLYGDLDDTSLKHKMNKLKDELYETKLIAIKCDEQLNKTRQVMMESGTQDRFLNKIYNPLQSPTQYSNQPNFYDNGYDAYIQNQMMGYITDGNGKQFPLYGRNHEPGRSDKFEYYTIDESRNRIKIPIKTKNYNELYDGDQVTVNDLSNQPFTFKKYDTDSFRYNPRIF